MGCGGDVLQDIFATYECPSPTSRVAQPLLETLVITSYNFGAPHSFALQESHVERPEPAVSGRPWMAPAMLPLVNSAAKKVCLTWAAPALLPQVNNAGAVKFMNI